MPITLANVSEVVGNILNTEAQAVDTELAIFGCATDYFRANIQLSLCEIGPTSYDEAIYQALEIVFTFLNQDGEAINLRKWSRPSVLDLCFQMQREVAWGSLTPAFRNDEEIYISLYRMIHISTSDLHLAVNGDRDSELLCTLVRMMEEWENLSPIFSGIETNQITTSTGINLLIEDPVHHA